MKKNEKLFDAIGQIDERYIAEALEPMYQESVGTSNENKAAMPKKGKLFFYRQRRAVAAAAALVICIGAAGIAQWRLHSENPDRRWRPMIWQAECGGWNRTAGRRSSGCCSGCGRKSSGGSDQNAAQGRTVKDTETCFAEIYLEVATANSGKITWRIVNEATQKPSAGEQIIRWNVSQKTVGK